MSEASSVREWVIYREFITRQVFTGIRATNREAALVEWYRGGGDLQNEREQHSQKLEAVDVASSDENRTRNN